MAFSAADVPARVDCLIDGQGYIFDDTQEAKAEFGLSPIFVERQNVQGDYGDEQQDFFVTFTQRDWSEGEQQRFFRQSDQDSVRRYWQGVAVDVREPGFVRMRPDRSALTFAAATAALAEGPLLVGANALIAAATATNLYTINTTPAITDQGAHGLGAAPRRHGMAVDGPNVYLSTTAAGTVGIRKWNGAAFSTFSASGADALAYLNNTLYGLRNGSGDLVRYDTAGALTSLFTWKDAAGTAITLDAASQLSAFGGKLVILRIPNVSAGSVGQAELWIYDGSGTSLIAQFPPGFQAYDLAVVEGTIFVSGLMPLSVGSSATVCPLIFYWTNGTIGKLWRGYKGSSDAPALAAWNEGLLFTESGRTALMYYDPVTGGIQTLSTTYTTFASPIMGGTGRHVLLVSTSNNLTGGYVWLDTGAAISASTVTTSLVDFDSSLNKNFHGVRVEFDSATDGDGGSVDIAYRVGDVDGTYTSLATGVTSGTEVLFSGVSGKSISIKVTLNKGTSTNGPVLKRISLRGSPIMSQYRNVLYTVGCYGTDRAPDAGRRMPLRDGTFHPKSGAQMAADLMASAAKTAPVSLTDELGTYTGVILPESVNIDRIRPGEFRAQFQARQV